jgi:hypothetical protein
MTISPAQLGAIYILACQAGSLVFCHGNISALRAVFVPNLLAEKNRKKRRE